MSKPHIGIIGGSGLYQMDGVEIIEEKQMQTPFGAPSDAVMLGTIGGRDFAFLPRHGRGHRYAPHELNFRANIYALKELGVSHIISVSAVGSLKENIKPGEFVVVDQFVDRTKVRHQTFFEDGIVGHVSFADPVCKYLRQDIIAAAKKVNIPFHDRGTYVCIEGPMFSSRAESELYRSWGMDVVGMTNYQEAKLALEAEISYATVALVTDYDCWHPDHECVDVEMVVQTLKQNVSNAQKLLLALVPAVTDHDDAPAKSALKYAFMTDPKLITEGVKRKLKPLIGKYFD
ncbi:MAG: S-methyl-5'-thioadenosine phosphorylase [Deltaproteobacteria bacterium CG_4_10_14_0_2_um_filter_43_8]|nr:MAG: S-methyl-5'-thioadenosine phosphorylase [Deltaproteobacteria bacterium CG11_big_fil_rev_8_21_14_0_20_42_23]PJA19900.1 MAG: S-methyl-5'-thioadenosine phosphorylase [Deltaproteobacteria bacterium CG_4_10_14_0_2_um_filter_43_8]PJC64598.1 MAG: S-methyl-5'-thioadenosine phosphorylase [Deltaproteobacteria bacterium CG_4_9_14_0_2_um_filter_42_21]